MHFAGTQQHRGVCQLKAGFTLVELLVVIGIIALLISLLLPSLNRAREQAKVVQCMSNQRQIALAATQYVTENKGYFPVFVLPFNVNNWWPSMLKRYLGNDAVFFCPVELGPGPMNVYNVNGAFWMFQYFNSSGQPLYGATQQKTRITNIRNSSSVVLLFEDTTDVIPSRYIADPLLGGSVHPGFTYIVTPYDGRYHAGRHFFGQDAGNGNSYGLMNIAFVDGHVGTYSMKEYVRNLAGRPPGYMHNYPYHNDNFYPWGGSGASIPPQGAKGPPGPKGEFWFTPWW